MPLYRSFNVMSGATIGKIDGISSDDLRKLMDKSNVEIVLK